MLSLCRVLNFLSLVNSLASVQGSPIRVFIKNILQSQYWHEYRGCLFITIVCKSLMEDNPFSHQSTHVVSQGKSYDLMWTFTCGRIRHGIMICRICHLRRISNEFTCRICQMKDFTGFRRISQAKFCVWIYFTWIHL